MRIGCVHSIEVDFSDRIQSSFDGIEQAARSSWSRNSIQGELYERVRPQRTILERSWDQPLEPLVQNNQRMWGVVASIAALSTILALSETYLRSSDSALTKPGSKEPVKLLEKGRKLARKLQVPVKK